MRAMIWILAILACTAFAGFATMAIMETPTKYTSYGLGIAGALYCIWLCYGRLRREIAE